MTHSRDFGAESRRQLLDCLSPNLVPDSGAGRLRVLFHADFWYAVHVSTTATDVKEMFSCTMSRLQITITDIDEMDSSIFASSMLIFGANFFIPDRIQYEKSAPTFGANFSAPTFRTDFWSVFHQFKTPIQSNEF